MSGKNQIMRWGVLAVGLWSAMFVLLCRAGVSTAPILVSDSFDTGNTVGAAPAGWKVSAPAGTTVRVVDASVMGPASAPDCVELTDNSPTGRPEMYREFSSSEAGRATASFKLNSTATAHAALQLRSAKGAHLCSVVFADNGMMRYEGAGGNLISTTPWTAGQWQTVQIEWFSDFTFNASLGDAALARRVHFVTNGIPSKVYITVGYGTITNRIAYIDDVTVVGPEGH